MSEGGRFSSSGGNESFHNLGSEFEEQEDDTSQSNKILKDSEYFLQSVNSVHSESKASFNPEEDFISSPDIRGPGSNAPSLQRPILDDATSNAMESAAPTIPAFSEAHSLHSVTVQSSHQSSVNRMNGRSPQPSQQSSHRSSYHSKHSTVPKYNQPASLASSHPHSNPASIPVRTLQIPQDYGSLHFYHPSQAEGHISLSPLADMQPSRFDNHVPSTGNFGAPSFRGTWSTAPSKHSYSTKSNRHLEKGGQIVPQWPLPEGLDAPHSSSLAKTNMGQMLPAADHQVLHIPVFRRTDRIVVKKQKKGTCGVLNSTGACDSPGGFLGWLNFRGCMDREMDVTVSSTKGRSKKPKKGLC
eukprot:GHVP01018358.1.p1 GENE.GHVP01018358.1~~GHVP01018358.1.p1  ORF type:complete len:356 (+),score=39.50 GHVP01018358.1:403-1470(+)